MSDEEGRQLHPTIRKRPPVSPPPPPQTFDDMGLKDEILRGIYMNGYEEPSLIQLKAIPIIISGKDTMAQAQSGSGKTAMFVIGALQQINIHESRTQVIVLSPTRDLAIQTARTVDILGKYLHITSRACVGGDGHPLKEDLEALSKGVQFVSGTPGRLRDLAQRGHFLDSVKMIILDEADALFDFVEDEEEKEQGLKEDTQAMMSLFDISIINEEKRGKEKGGNNNNNNNNRWSSDSPSKRPQIIFVSATFSDALKTFFNQLCPKGQYALVDGDKTSDHVAQYMIHVDNNEEKMSVLLSLLGRVIIAQCVIFCNTRICASQVQEKLSSVGFSSCCLHGGLVQRERDYIEASFRRGDTRILVASDVWTRGLDVRQVSLVIQYDCPSEISSYIHRVGRAGRYGVKGLNVLFVGPKDEQFVDRLEESCGVKLPELPPDKDGVVLWEE